MRHAQQKGVLRLGRWKYPFLAGIGIIAGLLVLAAIAVPYSAASLHDALIASLAERLDSDVELGRFDARVFPRLHIEGGDLIIRHRGRRDVPPLISVKTFTVDAGLFALLRKHITTVKLAGVDVRIPPDNQDSGTEPQNSSENANSGGSSSSDGARGLVIDRLHADDGSFVILPDEPGVAPKVWSIHQLSMRNVGAATQMPFAATLTNAVPPGEIAMSGSFGPWNASMPGVTPLDARFRFENARLGYFKGVYGTLSAWGTVGGTVAKMDIHGETHTPDFGITTALHSVPLHTTYHSIVDATTGNTVLERIDATFLDTSLSATGAVRGTPGQQGRTVSLDVAIGHGRIEDLLLLAIKSPKPPMTGALRLTTKFVLPPGERDVVDKLELDGRFSIDGARFTSLDIQRRIDELSHRSRGKDTDAKPARVLSDFSGEFRLRSAALDLPRVQFAVPGATVRLAGHYGIRSGKLNFRGTLLMAARVSDTVGGFKHVLLKLVDPLFNREGGGSAVPIKITGTRQDPDFGLDKGRILKR